MKKDLEYRNVDKYANDELDCKIYYLYMPNRRAELAIKLIDRWGMVAGKPEGKDSTGRTKLSLLTPEEVVDRAIATADLAYARFEEMDWLLDLPAPDEMQKESKGKKR